MPGGSHSLLVCEDCGDIQLCSDSFGSDMAYIDSYAALHYATCAKADWFLDNVMLARYLQPNGTSSGPLGRVTMFNDKMRHRLPDEAEKVTTFATEGERLSALRDVFGLRDLPENAEETIRTKSVSLP